MSRNVGQNLQMLVFLSKNTGTGTVPTVPSRPISHRYLHAYLPIGICPLRHNMFVVSTVPIVSRTRVVDPNPVGSGPFLLDPDPAIFLRIQFLRLLSRKCCLNK